MRNDFSTVSIVEFLEIMNHKKFILSAAGNTEPPAFHLLIDMGFHISKAGDIWTAENDESSFNANSPLELLGLVSLYLQKGEGWRVSDEQIESFLRFEDQN